MAQDGAAANINVGELVQLLQAGQGNGGGGSRKLKSFSSTAPEAWLAWRSNFELVTSINRWDHQRARRELAASMEGEAKTRVLHLPVGDHAPPGGAVQDYRELLTAYEDCFVVAADTELAEEVYRSATQAKDESHLQWLARVKVLFLRAYPSVAPAAMERSKDIIRTYLKGLRSSRLAADAARTFPLTLTAARDSVSACEAVRLAYGPNRQRPEQPDRQIHALRGDGRVEDRQCFNCKKRGHIRRFCPEEAADGRGREGATGRGGYRPGAGQPYGGRGRGPTGSPGYTGSGGRGRSFGGRGGSGGNRSHRDRPYLRVNHLDEQQEEQDSHHHHQEIHDDDQEN